MITHLDLFTGIGGFHLAAGWAGFETIGFSEIEPYCCKLLAEKWPEIKNYGDARIARNFEPLRGRVDVLSAGVPCQPASLAGKRKGSSDARWLWPATLDVVESVDPAWCIFENPPGILSLREFETVFLRLDTLGYQVRLFSVPANAVGADHLRYRVFIVANTGCQVERLGAGLCEIEPDRIGRGRPHDEDSQTMSNRHSHGRESVIERYSQPKPGIQTSLGNNADGCRQTVANANSPERRPAQSSGDEHHGPETGRRESADRYQGICDPDAADTNNEGLQRRNGGELPERTGQRVARQGGSSNRPTSFRITQPPICLSVNGLPGGLDADQINAQNTRAAIRPGEHPNPMLQMPHLTAPPLVQGRTIKNRSAQLKALGNSVCPQQAYPFFKAIAQVMLGEVTELVVHGDPEK